MTAKITALFFLMSSILYTSVISAQSKELSAPEIIDKLMELEPIIKYKSFKKDFEAEIAQLSTQPMSPENYQALEQLYTEVKLSSDRFIGMIKQDIMDFKTLKKMLKNEEAFAEKYSASFNRTAKLVNEDYPKLLGKIKQEGGGTRFIGGAVLLELGKMAFSGIVNCIRRKRIDRDELMSDLLQVVNVSFVDKLKMKPWNQIAAPNNNVASFSPTQNNSPSQSQGKFSNSPSAPSYQPAAQNGGSNSKFKKSAPPAASLVAYPTTKALQGSLEFRQPSGEKMIFRSSQFKTRDLTIGTLNSQQGAASGVFSSEQRYGAGTQFQIFTQNTGLLYVFAFNSNNTCYPIYPYSTQWVQGFGMSKTRDLTINPLMMKNQEDQTLVIPSPRADNGQDNYITISGNSSKEQLCLILTKSELDFEAFLQQIQEAEGNLSQRLTQVLGEYANGYEQISTKNGVIYYDLNEMEQPVLPLIFEIQRQ